MMAEHNHPIPSDHTYNHPLDVIKSYLESVGILHQHDLDLLPTTIPKRGDMVVFYDALLQHLSEFWERNYNPTHHPDKQVLISSEPISLRFLIDKLDPGYKFNHDELPKNLQIFLRRLKVNVRSANAPLDFVGFQLAIGIFQLARRENQTVRIVDTPGIRWGIYQYQFYQRHVGKRVQYYTHGNYRSFQDLASFQSAFTFYPATVLQLE